MPPPLAGAFFVQIPTLNRHQEAPGAIASAARALALHGQSTTAWLQPMAQPGSMVSHPWVLARWGTDSRAAGDEAGRSPWQENAKLRQLNARTQSLLSCLDQLPPTPTK